MVPGPAMPLLVWSGRLWKWCRTSFYLLNSNCKPKNIHGSRHMHSKPIFWKRSMWTSLDSKTEFPKNAYFLYTLLFGCSARPPLVILHCIWQEGAWHCHHNTSHLKIAAPGNSKLKNSLQKTAICGLTRPKIRLSAMQHT